MFTFGHEIIVFICMHHIWTFSNTKLYWKQTFYKSSVAHLLLLSGELLAEHCCTDDLMPSIPVLCLLPSRVDPKVLGLNILIYHSQSGGSWTTRRSPPIRWWSQRGGDDTVVVLLCSWSSQVPEKPQSERLDLFRDWQAARNAPDCVICSVPGIQNL